MSSQIPVVRTGPKRPSSATSSFMRRQSPRLAMQKAASAAGVTMNTLLQGAWALLLGRLSGERDIVFGATRACRRSGIPGANDIIGILINTLPVRVNVDPAAELTAWLNAIRGQSLATRPHEHTPLAKVQAGAMSSVADCCSRASSSTSI